MQREEKKLMRKRLANAYLSSIISIALVLMLIGTASMLFFNARSVSDYFKQSLQISVILKAEVSNEKAADYEKSVLDLPFVAQTSLVTKEQGTAELQKMLGEDFLSVFETSPVPASIDITLAPEYVSPDSLEIVRVSLSKSDLVEEVDCRQSLVEMLNSNINRISAVLAVFVALLLFISFALINNTVRLSVYARRFTIHTMKMVGATRSFICKPFVKMAVWQGLASSALASVVLGAAFLLAKKSFAQLFDMFSPGMLALSGATIVLSGVIICVLSTIFVVSKLVSTDRDDLYY